ncbi:rod shape-determining protein MreC [Capnocytophaga sp. ARDL2]|uniref:rod shape-determining protein MreC n=1 Tax=Capnocytophaga sp. ARDL2 TaxID=3238809 RepID=UPI00355646B2
MQQIFYFLSKNSTRLLFLVLLIVSVSLTIQNHSYHRSKFLSSANQMSGSVYEKTHAMEEYLHLRKDNELLAEENARLKELLYNSQNTIDSAFHAQSTRVPISEFKVFNTHIINNSYRKRNNYLTIRGGVNQQFTKDMGVINDKGVVGIVENVSKNFATVQSILNTKTKITAKVKNTEHFGTIVWDAKNAGFVQLTDIPKLANLTKGDSIVTGGISTIFPENIPIGVVDKVYTSKASNFYTINVRLFNDMTRINQVYVIENINYQEIKELEETTQDE